MDTITTSSKPGTTTCISPLDNSSDCSPNIVATSMTTEQSLGTALASLQAYTDTTDASVTPTPESTNTLTKPPTATQTPPEPTDTSAGVLLSACIAPLTCTSNTPSTSITELVQSNSSSASPMPALSDSLTPRTPSSTNLQYTLEPWDPPTPKQLARSNRMHRLAALSGLQPMSLPLYTPPKFTRYYELTFGPTINIRTDINIIRTQRELHEAVGSLPKRPLGMFNPTELTRHSLLVEVKSCTQRDRLLSITELAGNPVTVRPSDHFNISQGQIYSEALAHSSPDEILADLESQGVTKVEPVLSSIRPSSNATRYILHFATPDLPQLVVLGNIYKILVDPYIPLPRRCYKCQLLGHLTSTCRATKGRCVRCGQDSHEATNCAQTPTCVNCHESHPANSNMCPHYQMRREMLQIRTAYKLTSREAEDIVISRNFSKGKRYDFSTPSKSRVLPAPPSLSSTPSSIYHALPPATSTSVLPKQPASISISTNSYASVVTQCSQPAPTILSPSPRSPSICSATLPVQLTTRDLSDKTNINAPHEPTLVPPPKSGPADASGVECIPADNSSLPLGSPAETLTPKPLTHKRSGKHPGRPPDGAHSTAAPSRRCGGDSSCEELPCTSPGGSILPDTLVPDPSTRNSPRSHVTQRTKTTTSTPIKVVTSSADSHTESHSDHRKGNSIFQKPSSRPPRTAVQSKTANSSTRSSSQRRSSLTQPQGSSLKRARELGDSVPGNLDTKKRSHEPSTSSFNAIPVIGTQSRRLSNSN